MDMVKRPLTAVSVAAVLALGGAGAAWACDGGGGAGTYPGETAGSYPSSTTPSTTSTTDAASTTTATAAVKKHARRAHRAKHAKRS